MTCETEPITLADIGSAIRLAATEVFSVMLGIDVEPGDGESTMADVDHAGVVAVLGLTGAWGGSGEISCDSALSVEIARRLLMSECSKAGGIDEEVLDAVAEVANMIVGNVKTHLEQALGPMGLSTPAVFFGGDFETRVVGRTSKVLVPFSCPTGWLTVQIAIAPMARTRLRQRI
jgi:chemotaxis protein CheX